MRLTLLRFQPIKMSVTINAKVSRNSQNTTPFCRGFYISYKTVVTVSSKSLKKSTKKKVPVSSFFFQKYFLKIQNGQI